MMRRFYGLYINNNIIVYYLFLNSIFLILSFQIEKNRVNGTLNIKEDFQLLRYFYKKCKGNKFFNSINFIKFRKSDI